MSQEIFLKFISVKETIIYRQPCVNLIVEEILTSVMKIKLSDIVPYDFDGKGGYICCLGLLLPLP